MQHQRCPRGRHLSAIASGVLVYRPPKLVVLQHGMIIHVREYLDAAHSAGQFGMRTV
jgi:hypothetical protein